MQRYTVYLYLESALHVSGGISTHHQERIHLYLQYLVIVKQLLLPVVIVEEMEPVHRKYAQIYRVTQKKWELLKNPTKIEEIQEK